MARDGSHHAWPGNLWNNSGNSLQVEVLAAKKNPGTEWAEKLMSFQEPGTYEPKNKDGHQANLNFGGVWGVFVCVGGDGLRPSKKIPISENMYATHAMEKVDYVSTLAKT